LAGGIRSRDDLAKGDWRPGAPEFQPETLRRRRQFLARLEEAATRQYVSPYRIATVDAGLGDTERMFEKLEEAFTLRARSMAWIRVAKEYLPYREVPRFLSLAKRIGIPGIGAMK